MHHVALCAELVDVADFGIDSGEEEARVGDRTVGDVTRAVVPGKADAAVIVEFAVCAFWGVFWGEELHYPGDGIWGPVSHGP